MCIRRHLNKQQALHQQTLGTEVEWAPHRGMEVEVRDMEAEVKVMAEVGEEDVVKAVMGVGLHLTIARPAL